MFNIEIKDNESNRLLKESIEIINKKIDLDKIYRGIGEVLQTAMEDQFDKEGKYLTNSKWPGLALSTIKQRNKSGKWPGSILQVTGALRRSFTYNIVGNNLVFGTNLEYAKYLHHGTKNMPARPLFARLLNDEVIGEIREVVIKSLNSNK